MIYVGVASGMLLALTHTHTHTHPHTHTHAHKYTCIHAHTLHIRCGLMLCWFLISRMWTSNNVLHSALLQFVASIFNIHNRNQTPQRGYTKEEILALLEYCTSTGWWLHIINRSFRRATTQSESKTFNFTCRRLCLPSLFSPSNVFSVRKGSFLSGLPWHL